MTDGCCNRVLIRAAKYKPSDPCFLPSSTLMSFFLTRRVELTSLWSRRNFTESSDCSSSDCSRDWKKERRESCERRRLSATGLSIRRTQNKEINVKKT